MSKFNLTSFLLILLGSILLHTVLGSDVVSIRINYFTLYFFSFNTYNTLTIIIASSLSLFTVIRCRLYGLYSLTFKHSTSWRIFNYDTSKIFRFTLFIFSSHSWLYYFSFSKISFLPCECIIFSNSLSDQESNSDSHSILILLLVP